MAYVLGFIVADGSLIKNKRGACFLELTSTDKEIIYKIRRVLQSNLAIGEYQPRNKNYKRRYRIQIGSKKIFGDLLKLGITQNKSKTIKLPKIPQDYFADFLRGYFDGDGSVNVCLYKKKSHKKPSIILSCGFVSGSKSLLKKIRKILLSRGIVRGGTLYYYDNGYRLWFSINDSSSLFGFMYGKLSSDLFLKRKKKVFEKFFDIRKKH